MLIILNHYLPPEKTPMRLACGVRCSSDIICPTISQMKRRQRRNKSDEESNKQSRGKRDEVGSEGLELLNAQVTCCLPQRAWAWAWTASNQFNFTKAIYYNIEYGGVARGY